MAHSRFLETLRSAWAALGGADGALAAVELVGSTAGLQSAFAVGEAAAAQVAAATLAVAEVQAARNGSPMRATYVDGPHVVAAFRSERYLRPIGWTPPPPWDPVAGDYETETGWIRLHTNYPNHRQAALGVLAAPFDRSAVARAVRRWDGEALESAIVQAGGCAARMRTVPEWQNHEQGAAVAAEPLVHRDESPGSGAPRIPRVRDGQGPLDGVRVVDLTRVIAGPVCTRLLAAYGADVVRVDPPGFEEPSGLLADSMSGKRRLVLDLRRSDDRRAFEEVLADAHVVVSGYRSDALARIGYSPEDLRASAHRGLVIAQLDAYGWTGPWRARRGFDSLVQMSSGIAARGAEVAGTSIPTPLPAQALDHGSGYLLAAAACRALARQIISGEVTTTRLSLAGTARWLVDLGETGDPGGVDFSPTDAAPWLESARTPWGGVERVRCPGRIAGVSARWGHDVA